MGSKEAIGIRRVVQERLGLYEGDTIMRANGEQWVSLTRSDPRFEFASVHNGKGKGLKPCCAGVWMTC
ncbi:hypothetical protein HanXRQr2_Chr11g0517121 [Helianthus annuus]|uniref:Uncharacterized protein n=1 Tax=Helianthus annuus TaxID=4232 RepID=A0A9K3HTG3_HELAN|nr:hypothetical protein HanXRQr2_Chr11g0517121 [Helianthus annuus]KAJ0877298.1 hypothetical protein HanPSC8_Chr11g0498471 [Helianthus annuus]